MRLCVSGVSVAGSRVIVQSGAKSGAGSDARRRCLRCEAWLKRQCRWCKRNASSIQAADSRRETLQLQRFDSLHHADGFERREERVASKRCTMQTGRTRARVARQRDGRAARGERVGSRHAAIAGESGGRLKNYSDGGRRAARRAFGARPVAVLFSVSRWSAPAAMRTYATGICRCR